MSEFNSIKKFEQECLEDAKKRSKEAFSFASEFQKAFPIEQIKTMKLEDYLYVPYDGYNPSNSFCSRIWREAGIMSSKGNIRPNIFGIFKPNSHISIYGKYLESFGDDVEGAFEFLKNVIFTLLTEVGHDNYEAIRECSINRAFRYKLLEIYYPEKFVHVHTEGTLNAYCDCVGVSYDPNEEQVYRNLALAKWRDSVPEIRDWDNSVLMYFCDWLWRKNIKIDGSALVVDTTELALKVEEELNQTLTEGVEKQAVVKVRVNQGIFRDLLLKKYDKCCICGVNNSRLLIASHIKPWCDCEPAEKLDVDNGFLMCPNHDRLFDQGFISFDDNGKIIISDDIDATNRIFLNVTEKMTVQLSEGSKKYLAYHRDNVFLND